MKADIQQRFWSKVDVRGPNECWPWTSWLTPARYGQLHFRGKTAYAHRLAYEMKNGPIPEGVGHHGTIVRHKCDNPACVNPAHLEIGTMADNYMDMLERGRRRVRTMRGQEHGQAKLNNEQVLEIRRLISEGVRQADLSEKFGISQAQVSSIKLKRTWKNLP